MSDRCFTPHFDDGNEVADGVEDRATDLLDYIEDASVGRRREMRPPIYVMHLFKQCAVVIGKPDDVGLVTCGPPCAQNTFD